MPHNDAIRYPCARNPETLLNVPLFLKVPGLDKGFPNRPVQLSPYISFGAHAQDKQHTVIKQTLLANCRVVMAEILSLPKLPKPQTTKS